VSPIKRPLYPPDWDLISARLRHIRAGDRCECDGRCRSPRCWAHARVTGLLIDAGANPPVPRSVAGIRCRAVNGQPHPATGSRVVLTVAHLDRDAAAGDHSDGNLMVMCQCCHLAYDRLATTP
jgi:hypothetical protein